MRWLRWAGVLVLVGWSLGTSRSAAQTVTLRGFITDASDGRPLQGANVAVEDAQGRLRGAVSNASGYYQVGQIPPGRHAVRISFVGYEPFADTLDLGDRPFARLSVALEPAEAMLDELVVGAEGGAAQVEAGQQTVRAADLARIPTPDVSGDLATYLQSLPGVVAVGDQGGQLYIRGGTPTQNLVLLDGMLIYQPFHIVGFFSAFPEDLVAYADVYAGGFGARYNGRLSSVIDVSMRDGNNQHFEGAATAGPFLTGVRVEGPLRRGSLSVLGSMRRSVIERVSPALLGEDLPFRFGDLFVKLTASGSDNSRCTLSTMHTYDRGRIGQAAGRDDVFRWTNFILGGRCIAFPSASPTLFEITGGLSRVKNEVGRADSPERSSSATQAHTSLDFRRHLGTAELRGGLFTRMNWLGFEIGEQIENLEQDDGLLFSVGGYAEAELSVGDRLAVTPSAAVTIYPANYPMSMEPRLRMVWRPHGEKRNGPEVSAALGLYRQTVVGVSDERDAGSVFTAWMPAPLGDVQARAVHALLGWQQPLGAGFRLAAEGYYKRLHDLPVPIWSTIARFTTTLTLADGDVYGLDTRMEFQRGRLYGYVGYGLAQTEYRAAQDNFGIWFGDPIQGYHPPHDRRHQFNAVLSATFGRVRANVRWQYGSGLPFTRALGFDETLPLQTIVDVRDAFGTTRVLYERPYQGRLPAYHRLDASVERTFPFGGGVLTVQLGLINAYDRANLFYFDLFTVRRVDQLPLIPNLSVKLETQ